MPPVSGASAVARLLILTPAAMRLRNAVSSESAKVVKGPPRLGERLSVLLGESYGAGERFGAGDRL